MADEPKDSPSRLAKGAYKMKSGPKLEEPDTIRLNGKWRIDETENGDHIARRIDDE